MGAHLPIAEIRSLAEDEGFVAAVGRVYGALDARVAERQPVCINRGECCRFASFGHKLFVTPVELAYFVATRGEAPAGGGERGTCPHHVDGRCEARAARPVGCRVFYCDPASQGWQPGETEATLLELKELHRRFNVPYVYVEWLGALQELDAAS